MPPPHSLHCTEPTGKCKKKAIPTRVYHPESTEIPRLQMVQPARSSAKATRKTLKGEPRNSLVKKMVGVGIILSTLESRNESHPNQGGS
jgi:hypothetical protein